MMSILHLLLIILPGLEIEIIKSENFLWPYKTNMSNKCKIKDNLNVLIDKPLDD